MERRVGRSRGRGRPAADARTVSPIVPPATLAHVDISTSPLMAPGVCNSPGISVGSSFRVRIGERAITDGLCALLQAMLKPQVSQPPLTTNALLSLLQKMAPPALTLGRTAAPSWLQENTQQVVIVNCDICSIIEIYSHLCRIATSFCATSSAVFLTNTLCSSTRPRLRRYHRPSTLLQYSLVL